jgi:Aspartyl protease
MHRLMVFAIGLAALAGPGVGAQESRAIEAPAAGVRVPMLDFGGRPVVEVTVNGHGPYRMILDTGASQTVISPEWTDGKTGFVTLDTLGVGALTMAHAPVASQPIFAGSVPDDMPKGVLSAAAFPGYLVTLDYPGKMVSIRKGALPPADGRRVFQYGENEILPVAPVRIAGRELSLHVDSGSPGGVMLPLHFSKELPLAGELSPAGRARTVAGEFEVFTAPLQGTIELGEYVIDAPAVRFSDLRPGPKPGPGNVGFQVLRTFKVTLDASNRRLLFER